MKIWQWTLLIIIIFQSLTYSHKKDYTAEAYALIQLENAVSIGILGIIAAIEKTKK